MLQLLAIRIPLRHLSGQKKQKTLKSGKELYQLTGLDCLLKAWFKQYIRDIYKKKDRIYANTGRKIRHCNKPEQYSVYKIRRQVLHLNNNYMFCRNATSEVLLELYKHTRPDTCKQTSCNSHTIEQPDPREETLLIYQHLTGH